MRQVRDRVILHPETVEKAEKLAKDSKPRKRKGKDSEPPVTKRYAKRPPWVEPSVWSAAMRLADEDYKRLVVESATSILVVNR